MAQYISKDALVAEIEKIYNEDYKFLPSGVFESVEDFKDDLLIALDTLEVKEMDKNNEIVDKLHDIINFHKEKVFKGQWYNYMPEKVSYHNGVISGIKQCLSIIRNR